MSARRDGRATSGSTARSCRPTRRTCRSSTAASSSATACSRRCGRAGGHPTELPEHLARLHRSADGLDIALPDDVDARLADGIAALLAAEGLDGPDGDASIRITVSRGPYRTRGVLPPHEDVPATIVVQAWPVVAAPADHLERGLHLVTSRVRRDPQDPLASLKTTSRAEYVYARLEARRAGADDALFLTIDDHLSEGTSANIFLVRGAAGTRARDAVARLRDPARHDALVAARLGGAGRARPVEGRLTRDDLAAADEAFLSLERGRRPARDPLRRRADRRRPARALDAAAPAPTARR